MRKVCGWLPNLLILRRALEVTRLKSQCRSFTWGSNSLCMGARWSAQCSKPVLSPSLSFSCGHSVRDPGATRLDSTRRGAERLRRIRRVASESRRHQLVTNSWWMCLFYMFYATICCFMSLICSASSVCCFAMSSSSLHAGSHSTSLALNPYEPFRRAHHLEPSGGQAAPSGIRTHPCSC